MFRERVSRAPLSAWAMAAVFAPAALVAARGAWLGVLIVSLACAGLCLAVDLCCGDAPRFGRVYSAVQFLFLIVASSAFSSLSALCWQGGAQSAVVPILLLLLAAAAVSGGAEKASRACAVVFFLIAFLFAAVLAAGIKNVKPQYLVQTSVRAEPELIPLLLLPAAGAALPKRGNGIKRIAVPVCALYPVAVAVLAVGMLSSGVAGMLDNPFYEYAMSLNFLGVAERFEAIVSFALTMSFFCAQCLLAGLAGFHAQTFHDGWGRWGVAVYTIGAIALALLKVSVPPEILALLALVLWCVAPILLDRENGCLRRLANRRKNKIEKNRK